MEPKKRKTFWDFGHVPYVSVLQVIEFPRPAHFVPFFALKGHE